MFNNLLKGIQGFDIWAMTTMVIFFLLFLYILYIVLRLDKGYSNYMSTMPLEKEIKENNNKEL